MPSHRLRVALATLLAMLAAAPLAAQTTAPGFRFVQAQQKNLDGLAGAFEMLFDADRRHLYVTGYLDDAVAVFRRDPVSGGLAFVDVVREGVDGVTGIDGPEGMALSTDGRFLYVAGHVSGRVVTFARDPDDGTLIFVGATASQPPPHYPFLEGASALAVSPDGSHLYTVSFDHGGLAAMVLDPVTGLPTHEWGTTVLGFDAFQSVVVRAGPAGDLVYTAPSSGGFGVVRTYTPGSWTTLQIVPELAGVSDLVITAAGDDLYACAFDAAAILHFDRDPATGMLTYRGTVNDSYGLEGVTRLALSDDETHLYATSTVRDTVRWLDRDPADGTLTLVPRQVELTVVPPGLENPWGIVAAGGLLYVAGLLADGITVLRPGNPLLPPDVVANHVQVAPLVGGGEVDPRQFLRFAREVEATSDGRRVLVTCDEGVLSYFRDAATGQLALEWILDTGLSVGSTRVAVSPDNRFLYTASVAAGSRDLDVWQLDPIPFHAPTHRQDEPGGGSASTSPIGHLRVSPDGTQLLGLTVDGWLLWWDRDPVSGQIGRADGQAPAATSFFADFAVHPDSDRLYAVSQSTEAIVGWSHTAGGDFGPGQILARGQSQGGPLHMPVTLAVSPGGAHLYADSSGEALVLFDIVGTGLTHTDTVPVSIYAADFSLSAAGDRLLVADDEYPRVDVYALDPATGSPIPQGLIGAEGLATQYAAGRAVTTVDDDVVWIVEDPRGLLVHRAETVLFASGFETGDTRDWTSGP